MEKQKKTRGRPVIKNSKRQIRLKARAVKQAAGIIIKPGRPKGSVSKVKKVKVPVTRIPDSTPEVVETIESGTII